MPGMQTGSFRLFRVAGITVYLHWSWLLLAYVLIVRPFGRDFEFLKGYTTSVWIALELVTIFGIVLLHEFGHALACRSVGGIAEYIVLWPLGGIAYVAPPPRPGPTLWSIAAGPLVNLLLVPVTFGALFFAAGMKEQWPDFFRFVEVITWLNLLQVFFNLLPIYPLDGGQILQSILWFFLGRGRSLLIVSGIGVLAAVALVAFAIREYRGGDEFQWVLVLVAVFIGLRSLVGFQQARLQLDRMQLPRRADAACPSCGEPPLEGDYWMCDECGNPFDMFASDGTCPHCHQRFEKVVCPDCRWPHPLAVWKKRVSEDGAAPAASTGNDPKRL